MEACDGFLSARNARLLTGDNTQVSHSGIELLGIGSGSADAHVHNDLLKARNLVDVVDVELAFELGDDFVGVLFLQTRSSHLEISPFR